jgi:hypothetical protein
MLKEYLVTIAVNVTYDVELKAQRLSDLVHYHDNKTILPLETQNKIDSLIQTTGLNYFGEIVDRYCEIIEVVSPEEELLK